MPSKDRQQKLRDTRRQLREQALAVDDPETIRRSISTAQMPHRYGNVRLPRLYTSATRTLRPRSLGGLAGDFCE
jgi:hypothetical protein